MNWTLFRAPRWTVCAAVYLVLSACQSAGPGTTLPPGFDGFLESEHFTVAFRTADGSAEEARSFVEAADVYYERLAELLGPTYTPEDRILIALGGSGLPEGGPPRFPNVDREGRIMLFEYTDDFSDHLVEFPHELVHAFRRHRGFWHSGFWEEGFAEAISMEVYPDDQGFPRYGYPLDVVAGHLFARGEYIPLEMVRADHDGVGRACQLQAYLERASFFRFLVERRSVEVLIELAYAEQEPNDADYEREYGRPFDGLVDEWEEAALEAFSSIEGADELARSYRDHPAIRSRRICRGSP